MRMMLSLVAAAATLGAAMLAPVDALDKPLYGINFDLRQGPDWDPNKCKSAATIAGELKKLSSITKRVRTYALTDCDVRPVLTNAKALGMSVWLGVWVASDPSIYANEVATAQQLLKEGLIDKNVVGFNVGSEAVYRGDVTAAQAISYVNDFKSFLANISLAVPVAITDIIDTMIAHPEIVTAGDVVTINQFPFWERVDADKAAAQFKSRIQPLLQLAAGKDVYITETGWSTGGANVNASTATPAGAARYLNDFYQLASSQGWKYYYFQGFDSTYKAQLPGETDTVEACFGVFDSTGAMKPEYAALKIGDLTTVSKNTTVTTSMPTAGSTAGHSNSTKSIDDTSPGTVHAGSSGGTGAAGTSTSKKSSKSNSTSGSSTSATEKSAASTSTLLAGFVSVAVAVVSAVLVSL